MYKVNFKKEKIMKRYYIVEIIETLDSYDFGANFLYTVDSQTQSES